MIQLVLKVSQENHQGSLPIDRLIFSAHLGNDLDVGLFDFVGLPECSFWWVSLEGVLNGGAVLIGIKHFHLTCL